MIRKTLILSVVTLVATVAYAQTEKLTQNSFLTHSSFYSYPNEVAALKDIREADPKFVEISEWSYLPLKNKNDFNKLLLNEDINGDKWKLVSRVNKAVSTSDDEVMVFRSTLNLKKQASFREVFLSVGAAASSSKIYINDRVIGGSFDSKATVEYDITPHLKEGLNNLAIVCSSDGSPLENNGGLGILSSVEVYSKNKVHISDITYNTTVSQGGALALLESQVTLKSHLLNKKPFRLEYKLLSREGELVSRGFIDSDIEMRVAHAFPFLSTLKDPELWSPSSPYLYTMLFSIHQEGRVTEVVRQDVGIRDFTANPDTIVAVTFSPNLSSTAAEAQLEADLIRSVGVNTILSDKPMNDIYLTACDKAGLYVVDQINIDNTNSGSSLLVGGSLANNPAWLGNHTERVERQLIQNGAHTCVVAWQLVGGGANGYNIYESYLKAKEVEKRRPILNRSANGEWNSDSFDALNNGIVGAWEKGDMLTSTGELSEKSYKMMDAQSLVYIRVLDVSRGVFKVTSNDTIHLAIGDLTYKIKVNDIPLKEGIIESIVESGEFVEYAIEKYQDIPLPMQIKYAQQLRFGKVYTIEIFHKGALIFKIKNGSM